VKFIHSQKQPLDQQVRVFGHYGDKLMLLAEALIYAALLWETSQGRTMAKLPHLKSCGWNG
jgi:hypothetical protein